MFSVILHGNWLHDYQVTVQHGARY